jgi:hypothetical protein
METYKVIADFEEVKKMIDLLPDLLPAEVFFISLSARKKYLTDEERMTYNVNRAEMFARNIIREKSYEKFHKIMSRMETNIAGYTTKSGLSYPQSAVVTYININPSSMIKAHSQYQNKINQYSLEMTLAILNGKNCDPIMKKFSKLDVELMNCIQRCRGQKKFVDVDFDIDKEKEFYVLEDYIKFLKENGITYHVVETKGGYHVLMERKTVNCNFHAKVSELDRLVENEVIINKSETIPCPGTLHGNFLVKFVEL